MKQDNTYGRAEGRNRADIGRFAAAALAVIVFVTIPIMALAGETSRIGTAAVTNALDGFVYKVSENRILTYEDYCDIVAELGGYGRIDEVTLAIARNEETVAKTEQNLLPCSIHVHSPACYAGHNHEVCGCDYHEHTAECYCPGRLTTPCGTSSGKVTCSACGGAGYFSGRITCPDCNGNGGWIGECDKTRRCPTCKAEGRIWVVCQYCGGAGCSKCSSGASGGHYETCPQCSGSKKIVCSLCNGTGSRYVYCGGCGGYGTINGRKACSMCLGEGSIKYNNTYYQCSVCGKGRSTSRGTPCGDRICEYDSEGYLCGYEENDTNPVCDRIIIDVSYESKQLLYQSESTDNIDRNVRLLYLNGTEGTLCAELDPSVLIDTSVCGTYETALLADGLFMNASGREIRELPLSVSVVPRGRTCDKCGNFYYFLPDGTDPGCPYCYNGISGIRVELRRDEYEIGEELDIDVYAVREDAEEKLDPEQYWDTFDSSFPGPQDVTIGYRSWFELIRVNVKEPAVAPTSLPTKVPDVPGGEPDSGTHEDPSVTPPQISSQPENPWEITTGPQNGADVHDYRNNVYTSVITHDAIINLLNSQGYVVLKAGDAFSIAVRFAEPGFAGLFSKPEYTSGTVISE